MRRPPRELQYAELRVWPILGTTAVLGVLRPSFEHLDETAQPGVGLMPVDDAMVDGQRHIGHRAHEDRVLASPVAHDDALAPVAPAVLPPLLPAAARHAQAA